jgi:hypothetical protein
LKRVKGLSKSVKRRDPYKTLRDKAWKEFSIYVRRGAADWRGFTRCFTCPKYAPWQEFDSGHFKHGVMDFNPKNINPQCTGCNRFWHGRLDAYATALVKKYGPDILDELDRGAIEERQHRVKGHPYTPAELTAIYEKYKALNDRT